MNRRRWAAKVSVREEASRRRETGGERGEKAAPVKAGPGQGKKGPNAGECEHVGSGARP